VQNQTRERVFKPDVGDEEINMTTTITTNDLSNTTTHHIIDGGDCIIQYITEDQPLNGFKKSMFS